MQLPSRIADSAALDLKSDPGDMGTAKLPGRHVLDIETIRGLSERSDVRGLLRFATHVACMFMTGTLVWLSQAHWYFLVPALIVHGFAIVTMFAPMHECVHRTAFKTSAIERHLRLDCGRAVFLQLDVLPPLPHLASSLHAGRGA